MPDNMPDFDALAESYERLATPLTAPFARALLDRAAPAPGSFVVDVAAGTGALALPAAEAGCRVLAVDLAPGMVARLAPKLAPFPGCEARRGDCETLDLADASVDASFSAFGVAILPVWRKGLAEMVRVTRPGGIVALTAWPGTVGAKPMAVLAEVFGRLFPGRPFWPEAEFPPWTAASLRDALREAGCVDADAAVVTRDYVKPSALALVKDAAPFFGFASGVKALDAAEAARLEAALVEAFAAYQVADGSVRLPVEALVATGRVAAASRRGTVTA